MLRKTLVLAVFAGAALLGGCSAEVGQQPGAAGMAKSDQINRTALEFTKCMRDHGYQLPDPTFDEQGLPLFTESPRLRADPAYQSVRQPCRQPLNDALTTAGVVNQKGTPEQLLGFTRCMRDHGVDLPDPTPGAPLSIPRGAFESPAWQPAADACKAQLPPAYAPLLNASGGKGGAGK